MVDGEVEGVMMSKKQFKCNLKFNPPNELKFLRHDDMNVILATCTDYINYCRWHGKICQKVKT
jgi:hypothetical protein